MNKIKSKGKHHLREQNNIFFKITQNILQYVSFWANFTAGKTTSLTPQSNAMIVFS